MYATPPPYDSGRLDVGDGHTIYWQVSGNPDGKPAVALHGGPGGGLSKGLPRRFDPARYRIVQFDQRGCGRSTPHAGDWATDISATTTHHLVADIERLRIHLGVDRWLVWGASWGVTLALAYAERFPERVTELILLSITLTRRRDVRWLTHGAGRFFPEAWARFRAEAEGDDLATAYNHILNGPADPARKLRAVRDWVAWEDALLSLEPSGANLAWADEPATIAFARLVTHTFANAAWLGEDELLDGAARLAGIPGVLLHGRLDLECPAEGAWALAQAWPGAELTFVAGGHTGDAEMERLLIGATDRFARDRRSS